MELEFTADQEELRSAVRTVLERDCPVSLIREIVEKGTRPDALWAREVELDWPALTVPEVDGGIGLGFVELAVLAEELGRSLAPGPLLTTVSQFVPMVRETGSAEQRGRFLGAVAAGELTGTVAVTEDGSWEPAAVSSTATPAGDGWVLQGTKRWVMEAASSTEMAVLARTPDGEVRPFVVPASSVRIEPVRSFDPSRPLATVVLDGVQIDEDRALAGGEGITRAIQEATVALSIDTVGTCQAIFDQTLQYAKDRKQFGVPIGSFQAIKHKFANMLIAVEKARALSYFAATTLAEDDPRRVVATAMAKAAAGDCERLLAQEGIQCLGGIGYTWEADMHLYVKRAKTSGPLFGDLHHHRAVVAGLIGLA